MISMQSRLFGAILLVSGTTIGAGMLALPITTGMAGFFPAVLLMTVIWLFMMLTAFYLLEVNLRLPGETNLISMMHKTLGRPGEAVAWICYLLLLYSLLAAYITGCSEILSSFVGNWVSVPSWVWTMGVFVIFSALVYFGTEAVDFGNRILMIGLAIGYVALLVLGLQYVDFQLLTYHNFPFLISSASVITTSFGYHIIIPTLTTYLEHDPKLLKRAIFIGSLIPFVIYLLWQVLVMGILPPEDLAVSEGLGVMHSIKRAIGSPLVSLFWRFFAFFAVITSLMGVSLSLSDFLADGLNIKKTRIGRVLLVMMTFIPPLLFALFYPQGFVVALRYAGIFVVILLATLPTLMAWCERYGPETERSFIQSGFKVPGGRWTVITTFLLSLVLLGIEIWT